MKNVEHFHYEGKSEGSVALLKSHTALFEILLKSLILESEISEIVVKFHIFPV